ncbi:MAG: PAS domain S-box protein [Nanobdellota archaeon]
MPTHLEERRALEERVRELERQLEDRDSWFMKVLDNLNYGAVIYKQSSFEISEANRTAQEMDSFSISEVKGKQVSDVCPGVSRFCHTIQQAEKDNRMSHAGRYYQDGRIEGWRDNLITQTPSGEAMAIYRALERTEKSPMSLEANLQYLTEVIDLIPVPTFVLRKDHTIALWNRALVQLSGLSTEEMTGTNQQWKAFYHSNRPLLADLLLEEASFEEIQTFYGEKFSKGRAYEGLDFFETLGKWLYFTASPLVDEEGNTVCAIETLQDVTAVKAFEQQLMESESKYRAIYENAPLPYQSLDGRGNLIDVNPAWLKALGYERDDVISTNFAEFLHPDDKSYFLQTFPEFKRKGYVHDITYRLRHKDGDYREVLFEGCVGYDSDGQFRRTYCVFKDITQQKLAESERIRALEYAAEQAQHALVGRVADKMAHDFNNILTAVQGNAELASMRTQEDYTKRRLEVILSQMQRGTDLTKKLMTFAKDQETKQEFFHVTDKLNLVLDLMKKDLKDVSVVRKYEPRIPKILADPGMTQDSIMNLVQNSVHAMSKVAQPILLVEAYCLEDTVFFEIQDNGCGIPPEHRDSIFTPAFTLKGSRDTHDCYDDSIKGTGYGMANVKRFITKHNGTIALESELHKGTRVRIGLPVTRKDLDMQEIDSLEQKQLYPEGRILLVEDEPAIAEIQYSILTNYPLKHTVDMAPNAQVAEDLFNRNTYDLVSLDYVLPGTRNGMDLYKVIRSKSTVPVIFVSGNVHYIERIAKYKDADPMLDFIQKPCTNVQYLDKINEWMCKVKG